MRTVDDKVIVALHQIRDAIKNKDCCNGGGSSDDSSKEITIDDVVKFINDNTNEEESLPTKYSDIKHISEPLEIGMNICRCTEQEFNYFNEQNASNPHISIGNFILLSTNYIIVTIRINDNID